MKDDIKRSAASGCPPVDGHAAETLVGEQVTQVRHCLKHAANLRSLLDDAFQQLPAGGQQKLATIKGIGPGTAAVLAAKIIDIDRFATPNAWSATSVSFPRKQFRRRQVGAALAGRPVTYPCHATMRRLRRRSRME